MKAANNSGGLALLLVLLLMAALAQNCAAQIQAVDQASRLETQGRFAEASLVLQLALDRQTLSADARAQLEFELDRLRRIRLDYPYTQSELFAELRKSVGGLTDREFTAWVQEGRFDSRDIDSKRMFMGESVRNLFFRYPELAKRRLPAKNSKSVEERHWQACVEIKKQVLAENKPYVLPKRFRVVMNVTANPDAAPEGSIIRAWLPIPRGYPFQTDFELVSANPPAEHIDTPSSAARSVYQEGISRKGTPTEFKVEYEYTTRGVWFDVKSENWQPADLANSAMGRFVQQNDHVQFTPAIRALSDRIAAGETNGCVKARLFYEWIAGNIKYSFALEYSTIRNLSEYCLSHGYGDCGQEALLFITLCRLNNIPARWQSGWTIFPGAKSNHDWAEIYLEPYGWVPVDPYMGIYATRYATSLTEQQRREMRDFYFGGLDQYRMIANSDHNQPLTPPKRAMRSDNVDFQRGELESGGHNIYFDQFSYELTAKEAPVVSAKVE